MYYKKDKAKLVKQFLKEEIDPDLKYVSDIVYKKDKKYRYSTGIYLMAKADLVSGGGASITFFEVKSVTKPVFEKYNIKPPLSEWSSTVSVNFEFDLPSYKFIDIKALGAHNEQELWENLSVIGQHIKAHVIPVWSKYDSLLKISKKIHELDMDTYIKYFQGTYNLFNVLTILKLTNSPLYETKKIEFLEDYKMECSGKYARQFINYDIAFEGLIKVLDNTESIYDINVVLK